MLAYVFTQARERGRCWFIVHRRELLDQTAETFRKFGLEFSYVAAGYPSNSQAKIQLCTIQTLIHRLDRLPPPRLVAFDECHHVVARSWLKVVEHCKDALFLGASATPARLDGKGLGAVFNHIVLGPPMPLLMQEGHLADYDVYWSGKNLEMGGVTKRGGDYAKGETEKRVGKLVGDCVAEYKRWVKGKTCLVYCVTRAMAHQVAAQYQNEGVNAIYVGGDTPKTVRRDVMARFKTGEIPVVVSVDLFGEGLDAPGLKAIQMLRPTESTNLFDQQVGRVLRPDAGRAIVIDAVGNVFRHGLPEWGREWTLEDGSVETKEHEDTLLTLLHCDMCFAVFPARDDRTCPACGYVVPPKKKPPKPLAGRLEKLDKERLKKEMEKERKRRRQEEGMVGTKKGLEGLVDLAIQRKYKHGWAAARWAARTGIPIGVCMGRERKIRNELGVK